MVTRRCTVMKCGTTIPVQPERKGTGMNVDFRLLRNGSSGGNPERIVSRGVVSSVLTKYNFLKLISIFGRLLHGSVKDLRLVSFHRDPLLKGRGPERVPASAARTWSANLGYEARERKTVREKGRENKRVSLRKMNVSRETKRAGLQ